MKKGNILITWIITFIVLFFMGAYGGFLLWGANADPDIPIAVRLLLTGIAVFIILPVMIMMIVTAVQRKREIEEEDENDLSQY